MANLVPRQSSHQAHRRTHSNSQTPDKRVEIVAKLEGCIGDVLEATKAFKSPQQQSAHQNANLMFQQRILATQGHMGPVSDQDWLGTMMQCLNESMRSQQSSFVRNTSLDVALKAFACGVFETLGAAYFQELFEKYLAASQTSNAQDITITNNVRGPSGIPSPPREMGPAQALVHRLPMQQMPPSTVQPPQFPSSHHVPVSVPRPSVPAMAQQQLHGMPSGYLQAPQPHQHRPIKRPSPADRSNASRKRTYTSEALRQAAGTIGAPPMAAQAPIGVNPPQRPVCVNFLDIYQERDARRRQAVLGYERKWFVFRCYKHKEPIFFKTAEGAKHHLVTHHAQPHQHIDIFDMIRDLGVEVVNCDTSRAEMNNREAVIVWGQLGTVPQPKVAIPHQSASQPANVSIRTPVTVLTLQPAALADRPAEVAVIVESTVKVDSPSSILISDDELLAEMATTESTVTIKQDLDDDDEMVDFESVPAPREAVARDISPLSTDLSVIASKATEKLAATEKNNSSNAESVSQVTTTTTAVDRAKNQQQDCILREREAAPKETVASKSAEVKVADILADIPEPPEMVPDSPESSALSEPPSLQELEGFEPQVVRQDSEMTEKSELEDGEIVESCIKVASFSPSRPDCSSTSQSPKKRRISGASGSAPQTPMNKRKRLPSTPKPSSSAQKKHGRQSFWSPSQENGPSAHDQFKTRACKKCTERFYFRAQLSTHMKEEHPEVVTIG